MDSEGGGIANLDGIINFPWSDMEGKKLINYKGLVLCNESARWLFLLLVLLSCAASQLVSVSWFRGCGEWGESRPGFFQHYTRGVRTCFPSSAGR